MARSFDFVVGGGSIAGLTFAAEAAGRGASVLVVEEHEEIGEPEKCDGLVSLRGLRRFGYLPRPEVIQNQIMAAVVHSPGGKRFAVSASALEVVVLDRSAYDKQVARQAESAGATVRTGARVDGALQSQEAVTVRVGDESMECKYYVDATGPSPALRDGILPAAKYELEGDWVSQRLVDVYLDADLYPGFFAWVIPSGGHRAKVGAAGRGINPFRALDAIIAGKQTTILKRVSAPIYVGGPKGRFVDHRVIFVGESAGQVKPTTAGGIMTSVAGAVSAARWACEGVRRDDPSLLGNYQREWDAVFRKEMSTMARVRGVFEKLSNRDMESVIEMLATPRVVARVSQSDFDFHASALLGALGLSGVLRMARVVGSAEVRSLIQRDPSP